MKRRLLAAALLLVAASLVAASLGALVFLMGPLPSRRGRVTLPELKSPVEVRFDQQGVPHISSVLELDAWRALGFLHASDRLFQMELRRRAASGRLAEIIGPAVVGYDREARVEGWARTAERDWAALGPTERAILEAYADGVNAFLAQQTLPLELTALSVVPEPWTPQDSLAFGRRLLADLSPGTYQERAAFDEARKRGLGAALADYDAETPGVTHVAPEIAAMLGGDAGHDAAPAPPERPRPAAGSNAWAIAGSRTASGRPLLAGDPHLAAERPGIWYAAHLTSADGLDAVGLTLPGVPGIVIGHDGHVAWSLTMNQADDADLFVEQLDWARASYRRGDRWVPLDRTKETIHVKGAPDVVIDVDRTVHGPIVSRIDDARGLALARAFASDAAPAGPGPFLDAARARTGEELQRAWSRFGGPAVNVCWADASGAIGVKVAGSIPRRRSGDGRFPVPGWTEAYDWDGAIPSGELPSVTSPRDGFVVTANDDWSATGRKLDYPGLFADSDRADRARALASSLHGARVAEMRAMQNDVYSPYAARIVAAISRKRYRDPRASRAADVLSKWNARADVSGPARLFFAFLKEMSAASERAGDHVTWFRLEHLIEGDAGGRVEPALASALAAVEHADGPDPARWSWGRAHELSYPHPFAGAIPAAIGKRLVFGPVRLPGEWHTLDVAGFPLDGARFDVTHIPSARLIVDLADPDASRLVLPLGQSGQLFDRHAHDQLRAWSSGKDAPLPYSKRAVESATISMILFVPGA